VSAFVARRYFVRGREHLRRGEYDEAERELAAALELSPLYVEARVGYALLVCRTDPPRAAQLLRIGVQRAQRPSERRTLLGALGDVQLAGGDFLGAEESFAEAARLPGQSGSNARLHDRTGRLRAKTGRFGEALAAFLSAATAEKR
jgi:tetratricopeptide (TPR) repeat protein